MGRGEWGELENRLEVLLMHMLKWDHQPARRSRSWKATMREQRNAIRRLMRRSPSFKRDLETTIADIYPDAVGRASDETGLSAARFPEQLPYSVGRNAGAGGGGRSDARIAAAAPPAFEAPEPRGGRSARPEHDGPVRGQPWATVGSSRVIRSSSPGCQ